MTMPPRNNHSRKLHSQLGSSSTLRLRGYVLLCPFLSALLWWLMQLFVCPRVKSTLQFKACSFIYVQITYGDCKAIPRSLGWFKRLDSSGGVISFRSLIAFQMITRLHFFFLMHKAFLDKLTNNRISNFVLLCLFAVMNYVLGIIYRLFIS